MLNNNNASNKTISCRASGVLRKSKVSSGRKRSFGEGAWQLVGWLLAIQHLRLLTNQKKKITLGAKEYEQERERCGVRGSREARTGDGNRSDRRVPLPTQRSTQVLWPANRRRAGQESGLPIAQQMNIPKAVRGRELYLSL